MKSLIPSFALGACLLLSSGGVTFAADPHMNGTTGQPNQSCEDSGTGVPTNRPGNAFFSNGATFNDSTTTPGNSTLHYAGNRINPTPPLQRSPNSVSQYDVACFQQMQRLQRPHPPG
jgi:hypothetical protein